MADVNDTYRARERQPQGALRIPLKTRVIKTESENKISLLVEKMSPAGFQCLAYDDEDFLVAKTTT